MSPVVRGRMSARSSRGSIPAAAATSGGSRRVSVFSFVSELFPFLFPGKVSDRRSRLLLFPPPDFGDFGGDVHLEPVAVSEIPPL
eukprot:9471419-Pyramimonas_sp.AAC.1